MGLDTFFLIWVVFVVGIVVLWLYRNYVQRQTDDMIHVSAGAADSTGEQIKIGKKLDAIERWAKILSVIAAVFGLLLACLFTYRAWVQSAYSTL